MIASSVPTLIEFSEDYIEPIFGQKKPAIFLFRGKEDEDKPFSKAFADAANSLKGDILFVKSDVKEGIQQRLAEFIGVEASQLPTLRILDPSENMRKFAYSEDINTVSVDSLKKWINDFKTG